MKASDKTFKEGLAALETFLDGEFWRIFRETNHQGCEEVAGAPITEKHSVSWSNLTNWADRLTVLIEEAFEKYTALAVANSQFVEGEPIEWIEARVQQFLEPRLGHEIKVAHPDPNGTSEMSFAERVTGGQKAHNWITYWIAEACSGEGQNLGDWVGDGEWELDDEAVDSWQAPAWLITSPSQKDQPLEGWLAKRGFVRGKADPLLIYKRATKIYSGQSLLVFLQVILFALFACTVFLAL